MKKYLLIGAGTISLSIGVIGIFIPLLPTTPLLLLSSYCYLKSSNRLYEKLTHHKILGPYLHNYMNHRAINKKTKVIALATLWISLGISMTIAPLLWVKVMLGLIGIGVTLHLHGLKTLS
ncbi:MAG: YbaN family protein [Clostridiaceae bacterium]